MSLIDLQVFSCWWCCWWCWSGVKGFFFRFHENVRKYLGYWFAKTFFIFVFIFKNVTLFSLYFLYLFPVQAFENKKYYKISVIESENKNVLSNQMVLTFFFYNCQEVCFCVLLYFKHVPPQLLKQYSFCKVGDIWFDFIGISAYWMGVQTHCFGK